MYIPNHFRVEERAEMQRFFDANSFGQLLSTCRGRLFSSHLVFAHSDDLARVHTHMARANPQHEELHGQEVLISLQGPHGYVSPTWYDSPGVPTWNYQALHIYGLAKVVDDPAHLRGALLGLARRHESVRQKNQGEERWSEEFRQQMLSAIVGVEIEVTALECKYKLSQNRPAADREAVARRLRQSGQAALADAMEHNEPKP